ncbi:MAG: heme exporter protein [Bacteroidales bacterium]|jgi:heme exporter protein C|nr:heme exporter protein [Bacteroidales bacterium]MDN5328918.1 heme exporter protein [Bacteroidales bacterium]NLH52673.1 cytochrome c biogenesis protein CcsA [Bacteroidales bacterium]NPV35187.1 cytochrome c biogenesis protein CcsA [Bacteroidales bacterium]
MPKLKKDWWKITGGLLVAYSLIAGLSIHVPQLPIIYESIRNLFYHVSMWFTMTTMMATAFIFSIKYLRQPLAKTDTAAVQAAAVGLFFGFLGIVTGMMWANFTWGKPWTNDPQLNGAATAILVYLAYFVLRSSIDDQEKKARVSAVYNIFAFVLMLVFIGIMPRLAEHSIHPGKSGNPALGVKGLDPTMRLVFYPAVLGWIMIAFWIWKIRIRIKTIHQKIAEL